MALLHLSYLYFPLSFLIIYLYNANFIFSGKSQDFYPLFRVESNGSVYRYMETKFVPPSNNTKTGVQSKDVAILPEKNVSVRLYLPKISRENQKFPLLLYIHGGAFVVESAFSPTYDTYLHTLTVEANVVAVSINYRLAPEHKIPSCYDDSWAVMKWAAQRTEPWLEQHVDFSRVFLAGDSAGANIAHDMMVRAGEGRRINSLSVVGMALMNPFFGNNGPDRIWNYISPKGSGVNDPRLNPAAHQRLLSRLKCSKIFVSTASRDFLRERAWTYYETLKMSGWKGEVEIKEIEGEGHVFHLHNQTSEKARLLMKWVVDFLG